MRSPCPDAVPLFQACDLLAGWESQRSAAIIANQSVLAPPGEYAQARQITYRQVW